MHAPGWILCEAEALSLGLGSLEQETWLQKAQPDDRQQTVLDPAFPRGGPLPILGRSWFCPTGWKNLCSQALQFLHRETMDL